MSPALAYAASLLGLTLAGVPLAFAMIAAAASYALLRPNMPLAAIAHGMVSALDAFALLSIPFFLFIGEVLRRGGAGLELAKLASAAAGGGPAGAARACVATGTLLGGVSGVAVADASLLSSIFVPRLAGLGFSRGFAAALAASAGAIAPIMPPSVLMSVYGALTGVSVARLFLGGILPALVMAGCLAALAGWKARSLRVRDGGRLALGRPSLSALPTLAVGIFLVAGIVAGWFTATEAAAVGAAFLAAAALAQGRMAPRALLDALGATARSLGQVLFVIAAGSSIGWILAVDRLDERLVGGLASAAGGSPEKLLIIVSLAMLAAGCIVDGLPLLVIVAPTLAPAAASAGIDPVHLGVVLTMAATLGFLTPPVGVCMYAACAAGDVPVGEFVAEFAPLFAALLCALGLVILFPELVLVLPKWALG